jgi:hypothetical protein
MDQLTSDNAQRHSINLQDWIVYSNDQILRNLPDLSVQFNSVISRDESVSIISFLIVSCNADNQITDFSVIRIELESNIVIAESAAEPPHAVDSSVDQWRRHALYWRAR